MSKAKKRTIWSIVFFSLAGTDFLAMVTNIIVLYISIANDKVSGLPASTAFLLAVPYGLVLVIFLIVAPSCSFANPKKPTFRSLRANKTKPLIRNSAT
jgi:hypothetical protein